MFFKVAVKLKSTKNTNVIIHKKKFPKKVQQLTNYDAGYEASPLRGTSNRVIKECKGDVKSIKNLSTGKSVSEINHTY